MLAIQPAEGRFIRRLPELEREIGEKPAQLLLQIEYWIRISTTDEINGKRWTYQSTPDIQAKAFPSWSQSTINRVIKKLETLELLHIEKFNKARFDKTRWFSLNSVGIGRLKTIFLSDDLCTNQNDLRSTQNDARSNQNDLRSTQNDVTIPETPTEISALNSASTPAAAPREDAGAAGQSDSTPPEKVLLENPMPPVKVAADDVSKDDIRGTLSPADSPIPPVAVAPLSPVIDDDCPEGPLADLKEFFSFKPGGLELFIAAYGEDCIRKMIEHVRELPNVDSPPALVITKLRSGARGAWKWPDKCFDDQDGQRYVTGKYAAFVEH